VQENLSEEAQLDWESAQGRLRDFVDIVEYYKDRLHCNTL